jgi:hypothetical protein
MCMTQAHVWDHVVWTEIKVSGDSGGFFENEAKSTEFYFNVMAIEMKI